MMNDIVVGGRQRTQVAPRLASKGKIKALYSPDRWLRGLS